MHGQSNPLKTLGSTFPTMGRNRAGMGFGHTLTAGLGGGHPLAIIKYIIELEPWGTPSIVRVAVVNETKTLITYVHQTPRLTGKRKRVRKDTGRTFYDTFEEAKKDLIENCTAQLKKAQDNFAAAQALQPLY